MGVRAVPTAGSIGVGAKHVVIGQHVRIAERFDRLRIVAERGGVIAKLCLWKHDADLHKKPFWFSTFPDESSVYHRKSQQV